MAPTHLLASDAKVSPSLKRWSPTGDRSSGSLRDPTAVLFEEAPTAERCTAGRILFAILVNRPVWDIGMPHLWLNLARVIEKFRISEQNVLRSLLTTAGMASGLIRRKP